MKTQSAPSTFRLPCKWLEGEISAQAGTFAEVVGNKEQELMIDALKKTPGVSKTGGCQTGLDRTDFQL